VGKELVGEGCGREASGAVEVLAWELMAGQSEEEGCEDCDAAELEG
jgi:hypothetical protein